MKFFEKLRSLPSGAQGIILMLFGVGIITINDALMKLANEDLPLGETLAIRAAFVWIPITILAWRAGGKSSLKVYDWKRQLSRGGLLIFSSWCFFLGLQSLPLAQAIAISSVGPLFLTMLAAPFLAEKVGWRRWTAVFVGFIGAMIIIQPGGESFVWATLFPLGAALAGAGRDVLQRQMSLERESTIAILAVSTTCVGISGLVTIPFAWKTPSFSGLCLIATAAILLGVAHYLMMEALRLAEAATIAPIRYTNFLWATLWGLLIWGALPVPTTWLGISIIAASGIYILHRETLKIRLDSNS
jgi:drug/metabolite transporter (DMT)-like permease